MLRTRGQLAAAADLAKYKRYFIIPDKKDLSLFQKSSRCIEGIPLAVFMMIQQYLLEKEYRNLMNCNLATFQPIKYETVKYSLIPSNESEDIDSCADENKFEFVERLVNSVRDKSKQISMKFRTNQAELLKYREIISGIREISVVGARRQHSRYPYPFTIEMDFSMFNGINSVKLRGLDGITRIDSGLENVEDLEICSCNQLEEVKPLRNMKRVCIYDCLGLTAIHLENIDIIDINNTTRLRLNCEIVGSPSSLNVHGPREFLTPININKFGLDRLECLSLSNLPHDCNLQSLSHVSHLELLNFLAVTRPNGPLTFTGKRLKLRKFRISSWSNQDFPNITSLELIDCIGLSSLPQMLQLKELTLNIIDSLQSIPSFLKLEAIEITSCVELLRISEFFPILNECTINSCNQLYDISGLSNGKAVSLSHCATLVNVEALTNVPNVSINGCHAVRFDGFDQTQIASQRLVKIESIYSDQHLSGIGNIAKLDIKSCLLENGSGIHDIEDLTIEYCARFEDTSNLINITNSLTVIDCNGLERLNGLIGIPYVYIEHLANPRNIKDVSGLGHHQKLTIPSFPFFENLVEKYLLVDEMEEFIDDDGGDGDDNDGNKTIVEDQQQSVKEIEERKRLEDFFGSIENLVIRRRTKHLNTVPVWIVSRNFVIW